MDYGNAEINGRGRIRGAHRRLPLGSAASLLTDAAWHVLSMSLTGQLGAAGIEPVGMEDGFDVLEERALAFLDACEVVRGKAAAEGGEEPGNAPAPAR